MIAQIDRERYMSMDEVKQLRTVAEAWAITDLRKGRQQGSKAWMLVDLALSTGLRVAELAAIQIEDINLKRRSVKVQRLKRKNQYRETMAVSDDLCGHLKEFIGDRRGGPLFLGQRGPLSRVGLQRIWKSAVRKAGLPVELSVHSARHSLAVLLLKRTGNLRQVQKQLGHASPATTANMYADISFEDMQAGVNGLYT